MYIYIPGLVVFRKLQSDAVKPERERDIDFLYIYIYTEDPSGK